MYLETIRKRLKHVSGRVYQLLDTQLIINGIPNVDEIYKLYIAFNSVRKIPNTNSIFDNDKLIVTCKGKIIEFKRVSPCRYSYVIEDRLIDGTGKFISKRSEKCYINFKNVRKFVQSIVV